MKIEVVVMCLVVLFAVGFVALAAVLGDGTKIEPRGRRRGR